MRPALVRNLLFPAHERLLKRPTFSLLAELEESQWLSREEIEALQRKKLGALLQCAADHSPWHRERMERAGLLRSSLNGASAIDLLQQLPTMNKEDARANRERLVWRDVPGGAQLYNTGGSSGEPLVFHFGRTRQASDAAARMRARAWWDIEIGEREAFIWGAPAEINKTDRIKQVRDRLFNQLLLNAFEMSRESMDEYINALQRFRPRCVYGYASSLALLAAHARERDIDLRLPGLALVVSTGEPLYPHQRRLIVDTFGAAVANEFGSRDAGLIAHESPEGQMLVTSECVILEVLDPAGRPVGPGELGEAVVTGLCSEAQPFIRYRTGDMVRFSAESCRVGRGLHVLEDVMGRSTDFLIRCDGTIMHALALIYILRAQNEVAEFKVLQHSIHQLEVLVVPRCGWGLEVKARIAAGIRSRLGTDVRIEINTVNTIAPESSGKHRYVVSEVPLPKALRMVLSDGTPAG